ncbi:MAG: ABC transporter permease subunit [Oscillibacter sp.]|nr:ABC transporter permease subunit [Oscillibacter sp.]
MDWFPLLNSLRIACLSTFLVFFAGLFAARWVTRLSPSPLKYVSDAFLTLTLVLPPPVIGWLILRCIGPGHMFGRWMWQLFRVRLVMTWQSAALASALVSFPLMYRTARTAFQRFDSGLSDVARTLGRSEMWIFWNIQVPICRYGVISGTVLAFARALGEYGATSMAAGYIPARTATVSTALYQCWSGGNEEGALFWVMLSVLLSGVCLIAVSVLEERQEGG